MKLVSVNVGLPQPFSYKGREGFTSILKTSVAGERKVSVLNIEGDAQADQTNHGGALKAVYAYDISYYDHWKKILQRDEWEWGLFGENLTTQDLPDDKICIGNIYQIGTVVLKAIQPRFPCFKLDIRSGKAGMLQQFMQLKRYGTYFSVIEKGSLQAGDTITLIERSKHNITIQQLVESYCDNGADKNVVEQILAIEFLPTRLRKAFESHR